MPWRKAAWFTILLSITTGYPDPFPLRAQVFPADSTSALNPRQVALGFDKNTNTYAWDLAGAYLLRGGGWSAAFSNRFRSSIIRTDRNLIRDENSFDFTGTVRLSPALSAVGKVQSFLFSDQRSLALNSLAGHGLLGGLLWQPIDELGVSPLAGYKLDYQLGVQDRGLYFTGDAELRPLRLGQHTASGQVHYSAEQLDPRMQEERRVSGRFSTALSPGSENSFSVDYRRLRRDYYLPQDDAITEQYGVDHPIETRDEEAFSAGDRMRYRISRPLEVNLALDFSQRSIAKLQRYKNFRVPFPVFDEDIREFRLNGNGGVRYEGDDGTRGEFRFALNEREESYALRRTEGVDPAVFARQEKTAGQKNNTISQTQLSFELIHPLSDSDTLLSSGATVKLRYDTPSDANDDDRDELFFYANFGWIHRFSNRLKASLLAETNLRHTVYIHAERSANNLWNRVFRLAPSVEYRIPGLLSSRTDAEVIANYSVYDFEDVTQSVQSFSLRQMTLGDSASFRVAGAVWISVIIQLRLYERGELYWRNFRLRPLDFFDERTLVATLDYTGGWLRVSPGIRIFLQSRYGYEGLNRRFQGEISSMGPVCRAEILFRSGARILVDGWYQFIRENGAPPRKVPNLVMSVVWYL